MAKTPTLPAQKSAPIPAQTQAAQPGRAPHVGRCPKCEKVMANVTLQHVVLKVPLGREYHGVSYQCPLCQTVLSIGLDPLALKTDTVNDVLRALGKKPK